ncbi:hypothetical protein CEE45_16525 [Candidatus Heimdallarchaeota archaeon B3_Heim]|nr:MAG: hypothetical protein CEE45_16525 [Candidatus Heimdallarchaeota archaeon B3_Heim]
MIDIICQLLYFGNMFKYSSIVEKIPEMDCHYLFVEKSKILTVIHKKFVPFAQIMILLENLASKLHK